MELLKFEILERDGGEIGGGGEVTMNEYWGWKKERMDFTCTMRITVLALQLHKYERRQRFSFFDCTAEGS